MLNVVGTGPDLAVARAAAYQTAARIKLRGGWYRNDIAARAAAAGPAGELTAPTARPARPRPDQRED